jgi:hypothetical protein
VSVKAAARASAVGGYWRPFQRDPGTPAIALPLRRLVDDPEV